MGSGAGRLTQVGTSSTTSFQHDGLEPESTYVYRVKPVNSGGEQGQRSDRAEATTPAEETPAPPVAPTPAPDPKPAPPQRSDDKGQDNIARASHQVLVTSDWSLIPAGLTTGDQFRLIFLSSTKRDGSSTDIANYNTFVQTRAAAGDTDIQAYSDGFKAVGCTEDVDATDNTSTTGTGVLIYWLNGNKAADDYDDFYDGTWDDEANDKNELGENGPDTSQTTNYPLTGCLDDGTEAVSGSNSRGLGGSLVRLGRPNSSASGNGPLSSSSNVGNTADRPMYGLSGVFQVAEANTTLVSNTGQTSADFTTDAINYGQGFTTGSDTAGYTLDAIDIGYNDSTNTAFSASIWSSFIADGSPDSLLYSLTPPATFSAGNLTFTAPANATLTSGTTYFIMLALADAGSITIKRTATINSNEDADAAAGWSIANTYVFYSGGWGTSTSNKPLLVAVKGTVYAGSNDATLSALTVNDGTNDLTLTPGVRPGHIRPTRRKRRQQPWTTVTISADGERRYHGNNRRHPRRASRTALAPTLTDADTNTTGYQVALSVGDERSSSCYEVTAEDASTETYTVTVTRAAAATPTVSISADKTTAVLQGRQHHLHADAHRLDHRRPARLGHIHADQELPRDDGPHRNCDYPCRPDDRDLHGRCIQLPTFRRGRNRRGWNTDRNRAGRHQLRPGYPVRRRRCHRDRHNGPDRASVLHSRRGGRDPLVRNYRAHGRGRAAAEFRDWLHKRACRRPQRQQRRRLCFYGWRRKFPAQ